MQKLFCRILLASLFLLSLSKPLMSQTPFWQLTNGPFGGRINFLNVNPQDGRIFAGTDRRTGIYYSTDNGDSWLFNSFGPQFVSQYIWSVAVNNVTGSFFAGTDNGVFRSTNSGSSWLQVWSSFFNIQEIAVNASGHVFAVGYGGIFRSTDNGSSFLPTNITYPQVGNVITARNGRMFARSSGGLLKSTDNGSFWETLNAPEGYELFGLTVDSSGVLYAASYSYQVYRSTNEGQSWVLRGSTVGPVISLQADASGRLFATQNADCDFSQRGVFRSTDFGTTWTRLVSGITDLFATRILIHPNGNVFVGSDVGGIFRSSDNGSTWRNASLGLEVLGITQISSLQPFCIQRIFAGDVTGPLEGGIFLTTNSGNSWAHVNLGSACHRVWSFAVNLNGRVFAGGEKGEILFSDNCGQSWGNLNIGDPAIGRTQTLAVSSSGAIFAGTDYGRGIFRSTNNGAGWTNVFAAVNVYSFASCPSGIVIAITSAGVLRSTDNGNIWNPITAVSGGAYLTKDSSGNVLLARFTGSTIQLYRSTDCGVNWNLSGLMPSGHLTNMVVNSRGHIFAAYAKEIYPPTSGVYRTTNNGSTWTRLVTGLRDTTVDGLTIDGNGYLYVAEGTRVFRSVSSTTDVIGTEEQIPTTYSLSQNYPNPFNPQTKINFSIPTASDVTLKVYDLLGREVATLVNERLNPGSYETTFSAKGGSASGGDGKDLSSGVYFYRLSAGSYMETKKLLLLR